MPHPGRFIPGNNPVPIVWEARQAPSQGRSGRVLKISPPPGFDPRTAQPVASPYTDYAIPAPRTSDTYTNCVTLEGPSCVCIGVVRNTVIETDCTVYHYYQVVLLCLQDMIRPQSNQQRLRVQTKSDSLFKSLSLTDTPVDDGHTSGSRINTCCSRFCADKRNRVMTDGAACCISPTTFSLCCFYIISVINIIVTC